MHVVFNGPANYFVRTHGPSALKREQLLKLFVQVRLVFLLFVKGQLVLVPNFLLHEAILISQFLYFCLVKLGLSFILSGHFLYLHFHEGLFIFNVFAFCL